jgi:catechol 2,3-dioxygenase-like lactoylglutathione lyase family enzyme
MQILRLAWVGTRTEAFEETVALFRDVLGLAPIAHDRDFDVLEVPDGATVEVFGPASGFNQHLTSPVAGFEVDDLAGAERELRAAGTEIVLAPAWGGERAWLHFRAPDGHLYELMQDFTRDLPAGRPSTA